MAGAPAGAARGAGRRCRWWRSRRWRCCSPASRRASGRRSRAPGCGRRRRVYAALWRDIAGHAADGARAVAPAAARRRGTPRGAPPLRRAAVARRAARRPDAAAGRPRRPAAGLGGPGAAARAGAAGAAARRASPTAPASGPRRCSPWRRCRRSRGRGGSSPARSFDTCAAAVLAAGPAAARRRSAGRWCDRAEQAAPGALLLAAPGGADDGDRAACRGRAAAVVALGAGGGGGGAGARPAGARGDARRWRWRCSGGRRCRPPTGARSVAVLAVAAALAAGAAAGAPPWALLGAARRARGSPPPGGGGRCATARRRRRPAPARAPAPRCAGRGSRAARRRHRVAGRERRRCDRRAAARGAARRGGRQRWCWRPAGRRCRPLAARPPATADARASLARSALPAGAGDRWAASLAACSCCSPPPRQPTTTPRSPCRCSPPAAAPPRRWAARTELAAPARRAGAAGAARRAARRRRPGRPPTASSSRATLPRRLLPAMAAPSQAELAATWRRLEGYLAGTDLQRRVAARRPTGCSPPTSPTCSGARSPLDRANALTRPGGAAARRRAGVVLVRPAAHRRRARSTASPMRWGPLGPPSWQRPAGLGRGAAAQRRPALGQRALLAAAAARASGWPRRAVEELAGRAAARRSDGARPDGAAARGALRALRPRRRAPRSRPGARRRRCRAAAPARSRLCVADPRGRRLGGGAPRRRGTAVLFLPVLGLWAALERGGARWRCRCCCWSPAAAALVALLGAHPRLLPRRCCGGRCARTRSACCCSTARCCWCRSLRSTCCCCATSRSGCRPSSGPRRGGGALGAAGARRVRAVARARLRPRDGARRRAAGLAVARPPPRGEPLLGRARINASSKRELFSAGLLPERIPGDIYAQARAARPRPRLAHQPRRRHRLPRALRAAAHPRRRRRASRGSSCRCRCSPSSRSCRASSPSCGGARCCSPPRSSWSPRRIGGRLAGTFTRPHPAAGRGDAAHRRRRHQPRARAQRAGARRAGRRHRRDGAPHRRGARSGWCARSRWSSAWWRTSTPAVVSLDERGPRAARQPPRRRAARRRVGDPLRETLAAREALAPVARFLAGVGARSRAGGDGAPAARRRASARCALAWVPVPGAGEPSALLVVEDVTEVLRSQRLQAWAEMARIIAHEIKNPLTPIRLSTEHMMEVHQRDPERFAEVFERCTGNILRQVDELQQIAQEFSTYSRIPRLDAQPGDLAATVGEVVETYRAASPAGVAMRFAADAAGAAGALRRPAAAAGAAQPDRERAARERRPRRGGGAARAATASTARDHRRRPRAGRAGRSCCSASSTPTSRPTTPAPASGCRSPGASSRSTAAPSRRATAVVAGSKW